MRIFQVLTATILDYETPLVIVFKKNSKCHKVYAIYNMNLYMASPLN